MKASRLQVMAASGTIQGHRESNQDRAMADAQCLIVADGMGGTVGGDLAAQTAISAGYRHIALGLHDGVADAPGAVTAADVAVRSLLRRPGLGGSGTTVTVALLHADRDLPRLTASWLGDSPAWLLRGMVLQQITRANNRAQLLAEQGLIRFEEAPRHPSATQLTRAAGIGPADPPEVVSLPIVVGDRVLVASDGLESVLPPAEIGARLAAAKQPFDAVTALLEAAAQADVEDNVAVAVAFLTSPQDHGAFSPVTGPLRRAHAPESDEPTTGPIVITRGVLPGVDAMDEDGNPTGSIEVRSPWSHPLDGRGDWS